ncbi:MAG: U32 family peptidase, partial [Ruminiclostridium sp.]|nr:U32 family peptidase [Ruminiclostridium sp.]
MLEILAPCGNEESLNAALNSGADAVYLGLKSFSARRNAANFSGEELEKAVNTAHRQGVRVHVTLNTIVFDDEMSELEKTVEEISLAKADGVIVQDLGVVKKIKEVNPELRLHGSTQMTVTSASGAEFALKQGFSRVVLPRELSLEEIRNITSRVEIETEVFVHGALCVCLSGQCLLSAVIGGRSGNRGLCAQPCRLNYCCDDRDNVLSLKDLSLINDLRALEQAGVTSAKIEGRMKRPEYVAAAVYQCRLALRGEKADEKLLGKVFSRSGFTRGYFDGSFSVMQGIRQKEDADGSSEALAQIRQLYKSPCKRFVLDMEITVKSGQPVCCKAECSGISINVYGEVPQKAINRSITKDEIVQRMG